MDVMIRRADLFNHGHSTTEVKLSEATCASVDPYKELMHGLHPQFQIEGQNLQQRSY